MIAKATSRGLVACAFSSQLRLLLVVGVLFCFALCSAHAATAIIPYLQVNGAAWQETNTATVAAGSTVDLGPQPASGGTWSWSGPNGFTSTTRQINAIPLSTGVNSFIATYTDNGASSTETFTITVTGPNPIVPYLQVNGAAWQETNTATVAAGSTVDLGPQPTSGGRLYLHSAPNQRHLVARE